MCVLATWFSRERRERLSQAGEAYRRRADSGGGKKNGGGGEGGGGAGWRQAKRDGEEEEVAVAGFEGQVQNEMERGGGEKRGREGRHGRLTESDRRDDEVFK